MPITMESIEQVMGDRMKEFEDYKLARHKDVISLLGRGFEKVAEVKDSTDDQSSTMLVMAKKVVAKKVVAKKVEAPKPEPKPEPKKVEPPPPTPPPVAAAPPVQRLGKKKTMKKKTR